MRRGGRNRDAMGPGLVECSQRNTVERMAVHAEPEEAFGTGGRGIRDAAAPQKRVYAFMHVYDWVARRPALRQRRWPGIVADCSAPRSTFLTSLTQISSSSISRRPLE